MQSPQSACYLYLDLFSKNVCLIVYNVFLIFVFKIKRNNCLNEKCLTILYLLTIVKCKLEVKPLVVVPHPADPRKKGQYFVLLYTFSRHYH